MTNAVSISLNVISRFHLTEVETKQLIDLLHQNIPTKQSNKLTSDELYAIEFESWYRNKLYKNT